MHEIDLTTWPRRQHYAFFRTLALPYFNLSANVDVTALHAAVKARGASFTAASAYVLTRAANADAFPEFRQRLRGERVVQHDRVSCSVTVLGEGDLFGFCTLPYAPDFAAFAGEARARMARAKTQPSLEEDAAADDLIFITNLPWVAFTSVQHPVPLGPADSFPRLATGRVTVQDGRRVMPLAVQGHHALMDGVHVGRYFLEVQRLLDDADAVLGG
ncbi:chloramphenicol acetyltransferase [Deinococcus maricopensis]|uniref:Chloramphenicol acetyltransferase n=1 Tax=Deinococcus maricopensis (strain DSM 21211 / LMG 22137 / NRRL B-23946 / LB-34) TaxID=709986 RepID=E8U8T0_DEIML|nr:chloramphenicol acetyltransferase [Deinococcus maricopensis]ADV67469.1 chloramphenicol acetyltransferase [Deinococcus maricopensis DSM 21211]